MKTTSSKRSQSSRRIIDLSLPIDNNMPGVKITQFSTIESKGWNTTTLSLYSHCGTHMLGVEQLSVADVNNVRELTEVHHILLRGGVVIVEGLANLDLLKQSIVEFVALPMRIVDGDGSPVRAIAIEENG